MTTVQGKTNRLIELAETWSAHNYHPLPVVLTRELRSSRLDPTSWNCPEPKVLIVSAAPAGLDVPLEPHVHVLRAALEPWIRDHAVDEEQGYARNDTVPESPYRAGRELVGRTCASN